MTKIVFDYIIPIRRKATARKRDPQVSHDAAACVEMSKAETQRQYIKNVLTYVGPHTVAELAENSVEGWTAHELGKRICEIEGIAPTGEKRGGMRVWGLI